MKWNNVDPDIRACQIDSLIEGWSAIDITKLLIQTDKCPLIVLPDCIRQKIMDHLTTQRVELGGLLIGNVISIGNLDDGLVAVVITDSIESSDFDSTSVSLSMGTSVWQTANQASNDTTFVVGWYHSHPNLGAFFSGVDRKTQKDFFTSEYNVGLVIDPIRYEEAWFIGEDSIEVSPEFIHSQLPAPTIMS